MATRKYSAEDRQLEQEIRNSTKVSSYFDDIIDDVYNGKPMRKGRVPNYSDRANARGGLSNETGGISMYDTLASSDLGASSVGFILKNAATEAPTTPVPRLTARDLLSENQKRALQKYPALIEFLGTEDAKPLISQIAEQVRNYVVTKIAHNSQEISKFAQNCVVDKHNVKQYFVGEDESWACMITASGPFRGDEAFYYKQAEDKAFILRKINDEYVDVTKDFNVIHEFAERN